MLTSVGERRPRGEAGTTLAELVVCMALTTVVGSIALGFFVWTGDATRATTADTFVNEGARTALTTTAGLLRLTVPGSITPGAVDGRSGVSSTVTFAASDNVVAGCDRRPAASVVLTIASGTLTMTRTGPVSAPTPGKPCVYRTNVVSSKVIVGNVQSGSGFDYAYRKVDGAVSTDAAEIGSVGITLVLQSAGGSAQTYTATAVVSGG